MQFQIPQFIEIEDKVFGPFTFKQFIYLMGAVAVLYIPFKFWGLYVAIITGGPFAAFALALAFAKVNGRPFAFVAESGIKYLFSHKLYLWRHKDKVSGGGASRLANAGMNEDTNTIDGIKGKMRVPVLSQNKLKDIAWSLDIRTIQNQKPEVGAPSDQS